MDVCVGDTEGDSEKVNKNQLTPVVSWDRHVLGAAYLRRHPPRFATALTEY